MRAFQMISQGQPPAIVEVARPQPGEGEVLLRIMACGLNFADLLMIKGSYQDCPELPFTLGMELAGMVEAQGSGVTLPALGTRVAVFSGHGGLAEYGCFAAARCITLPDSMDFDTAAALQVAYGTSHLALNHRANLRPGETLLVLGAAGGVGLSAITIGKLLGARVIAVARGAEKLAVAQAAGADHLIDSDACDLRTEVKALGGADVCYDPVGGDLAEAALRAMRPEGRILPIGFASGTVPHYPANHLLVKNLSVLGVYWGGYLAFAPQILADSLAQVLRWYEAGALHPHISHRLPLDRAAEALALLRERKSTGKVVVTMP